MTRLCAGGALCALVLAAGCGTLRGPDARGPDAIRPEVSIDPEALALFSRGFGLEIQGRPQEAVAWYEKALLRDPDYIPLYARTGVLYLRQGRKADAQAVFARLAARRPQLADPRRWMAECFVSDKDYPKAEDFYRQALRADPTDGASSAGLADLLIRQNRDDDALAALRRSLDRVGDPAMLLPALGKLYERAIRSENRLDRSVLDGLLHRIVEAQPDREEATLFLANLYSRCNEPEQAERELRKLTEGASPSKDPRVYTQWAAVFLARQDEPGTIAMLEKAVQIADPPHELHRLLAELYLRQSAQVKEPAGQSAARDRAIDALRRSFVDTDPMDLRLRLADLLILQGRKEEAREEVERLAEHLPDTPPMQQELAVRFAVTGDLPRAIALLEDLTQRNPSNFRMLLLLGDLHRESGHGAQAQKAYEQARQAAPEELQPQLRLALLLLNTDPPAAFQWLKEVVRKRPDDLSAVKMLGLAAMRTGAYEEAATCFQRALDETPSETEVGLIKALTYHLAAAHLLAGHPDQARRVLWPMVEKDPSLLADFMGVLLSEQKDSAPLPPVLADWTAEAARQWPDVPAVHLAEAGLAMAARDFPRAIAAYAEAERADRATGAEATLTPDFYFWFGSACEQAGDVARADALLEECLQRDPNHAEALNYLAYTWAERGVRLEEALAHARRALERSPGSGAFLDTLGWVYFKLERYQESLVELQKAAEAMPDDPTILEHVGDALSRLSRMAEAAENWKKALAIDPQNKRLRDKIEAAGSAETP